MEYDNDRIRRHTNKTEIVFWCALVLAAPLINFITVFLPEPAIGLVLLLVGLILFPAYLLYSRVIMPIFFLRGRPGLFILVTFGCFLVIQLLIFSIYALILNFSLTPLARSYFSFHYYGAIIRESLWAVLNMFLAVGAFFIRKANDEKDLMAGILKDNTFFKLRYLRAQLNPHFLFNTLNSIYSLSLQKSDRAPEMVVKLADIMRYLIYECDEEKISLDK